MIYAATGMEADRSFTSGLLRDVEHYPNGDYLRKLSRDTMRGLVERAKRDRNDWITCDHVWPAFYAIV